MQKHVKNGDIIETFAPYRFHKYYPRFPHGTRIRSSQLELGTQWVPIPIDEVRMPNLYMSREAPDFIVLSDLWYHRFIGAEGVK
ncbi:hypothetical protein C2W62_52760, partial [Candidatus Entotheonella serta]